MSKHPYRWPCSVPGCRCTHGADRQMNHPADWALCRKHWPLVPRKMKQMMRRALQRHVDAHDRGVMNLADGSISFSTKAAYLDHLRATAAYDRLCRLAVRKACERALGIG